MRNNNNAAWKGRDLYPFIIVSFCLQACRGTGGLEADYIKVNGYGVPSSGVHQPWNTLIGDLESQIIRERLAVSILTWTVDLPGTISSVTEDILTSVKERTPPHPLSMSDKYDDSFSSCYHDGYTE